LERMRRRDVFRMLPAPGHEEEAPVVGLLEDWIRSLPH
jgi:hypothetical protein